jgi:hypothetical protein
VELIQTTGYELARSVIQFSSRLTPLLFFRLQSTIPVFVDSAAATPA